MEFSLRPLGFMEFLQNNNHQTVNKMKWIENRKKNPGILSESLRVIVSVCVNECMCVCMSLRGSYDKFPDFFSYGHFYW